MSLDPALAREMLAFFGYPDEWRSSGFLSDADLSAQYHEAKSSRPGGFDRLMGAEHYRNGAFATALRRPDVRSGERLDELLELIVLDPDPVMAGMVAASLLTGPDRLDRAGRLRVAQHAASATYEAPLVDAMTELVQQKARPETIVAWADRVVALASPAGQLALLEEGAPASLVSWLARNGATGSVRDEARRLESTHTSRSRR